MPKGCYERSPEQKAKLRAQLGNLGKKGENNPNWRGGKASHPLYLIYNDLKRRCTNPDHTRYSDYGGRGIQIDPQWAADFWSFVRDVGERPVGKTRGGRAYWQLDRIDNDGNYEPGNVRWATPQQQATNQRERRLVKECRKGHEMTEENSYYYPSGARRCRECARVNDYNRTRSKKRRGELSD